MPTFLEALQKAVRDRQHVVATVNIVATLTIALVAALAGLAQAIIAANQTSPLPQIQAKSVAELRTQIDDRKKLLQRELEQIEALLQDIARIESAGSGSAPQPQPQPAALDPWWKTVLKTLVVYMALFLAAIVTLPALAFDLVALLSSADFPALRGIWRLAWSETAVSWYWNRGSAVNIGVGVVALIALSSLGAILESRSDKKVASGSPA